MCPLSQPVSFATLSCLLVPKRIETFAGQRFCLLKAFNWAALRTWPAMPAGGRWQGCQKPLGSALTNTLSLLPPHQPRQQDTPLPAPGRQKPPFLSGVPGSEGPSWRPLQGGHSIPSWPHLPHLLGTTPVGAGREGRTDSAAPRLEGWAGWRKGANGALKRAPRLCVALPRPESESARSLPPARKSKNEVDSTRRASRSL